MTDPSGDVPDRSDDGDGLGDDVLDPRVRGVRTSDRGTYCSRGGTYMSARVIYFSGRVTHFSGRVRGLAATPQLAAT